MSKNKKKIALAVTSFNGGGAERVMVTLANKYIEWGYEVDFIVGFDEGPYKKILNSNVNKFVLYDKAYGRLKRRIRAFLNLRNYLSNTDSDVLMSTIRNFNVFVTMAHLLSTSKVKLILREADTLDRIFDKYQFKDKVLLCLMRFFYPKALGLVANCKVTKTDLCAKINIKENAIRVIYNPIDLSVVNRNKNIDKVNKKIVACGRLDKKKNFNDLIRVIPLVKEKYPNLVLEILGEGQERENLETLIESLKLNNSVKLVGFVDNPYAYYSQADVFVQTSLWEGFGYVLAEAMACGTAVVAYDSKGAMREILADGKYGILSPVGDLQALADAIVQQIEKPTSSELLIEAVERFDVDIIARQYLDAMGVK
ncbi:glycosyltransferase [Vibrio cincinnatiensis]|uniref:glycosyltransferase n=1 Tax=Vibrio cincinnatiensis TaxID=675 RepID=UPI001EDF750F|nr:glycosyltransferase [Vibrio cincinnatiensis]MCG3741550.1 glycosyltransferase [Vibrio cincinnatiensis]